MTMSRGGSGARARRGARVAQIIDRIRGSARSSPKMETMPSIPALRRLTELGLPWNDWAAGFTGTGPRRTRGAGDSGWSLGICARSPVLRERTSPLSPSSGPSARFPWSPFVATTGNGGEHRSPFGDHGVLPHQSLSAGNPCEHRFRRPAWAAVRQPQGSRTSDLARVRSGEPVIWWITTFTPRCMDRLGTIRCAVRPCVTFLAGRGTGSCAMSRGWRPASRVTRKGTPARRDTAAPCMQAGHLRRLAFKGGTCLRLCHGGLRFSEDLDSLRDRSRRSIHALLGDIENVLRATGRADATALR